MPTLIGDGGHARDIWATLSNRNAWFRHAHHSEGVVTLPVTIGINDPQLRAKVAKELGITDRAWKHPHTFIGPDCTWGPGTHINYAVSMTRTTIGHHCTIAPGVTICGDVVIGDRVFIGAGAIITNLTRIPDDTFIKAGTVWTTR